MQTMIERRTNLRNDRGQTMVEFALVLPVLCLVIFGIIQCGILYNHYITLTDATRVGARKAAVSRQLTDPGALAKAATINAASGLSVPPLDVQVTAPAGWVAGADVTVQATYPYDLNILGIVVASGKLNSKTTERLE
jgi:Flp pilus assembly protein TadG